MELITIPEIIVVVQEFYGFDEQTMQVLIANEEWLLEHYGVAQS